MEIVPPESTADHWEIPDFVIHEKIGEGGMGQVYRATQVSRQRVVAIKVLHPWLRDQKLLLAFQRESQLMASLCHPHVVAIHASGEIDGRHYLVMEYVSGASLRSALKPGRPRSVTRAAPLLDAIAQALMFIHHQGILHLDLKPENVLCGERGAIKITDFGLALPRVDARTLFALGLAQGTLDYCAPEQCHGLPLDQRSDVFSLAVVSYELLTGRVPGRVYVPATRRNPRLPGALDAVLQRGLSRDPDERYGSVAEFRNDLADVSGAAVFARTRLPMAIDAAGQIKVDC